MARAKALTIAYPKANRYRIVSIKPRRRTIVRVMSTEVPNAKPARGRARRIAARHWLAIVLIVLAVIFVVQNTVRHEVHFLWVSVEAATWVVLIVIFLAGVVTGWLLGRRRR
jgi:lipopolysaccharide assembly protein A